jgi:hypothetical protein
MLNDDSIAAVANSCFSTSFVKPLYPSYCFSNIPGTIAQALGVSAPQFLALPGTTLAGLQKRYRHVVFLFIDAFGWRFLDEMRAKSRLIQDAFEHGVVSQLTAQFPSTTAAEVVTAYTGLPVGEHGVYEWFIYEPSVDAMITPLLFSHVGQNQRDTLKTVGGQPAEIFGANPFLRLLTDSNVAIHTYLDVGYAFSTANKTLSSGSKIHGYKTFEEALGLLQTELASSSPSYHYLYCDQIDGAMHHYGPTSVEAKKTQANVFMALDQWWNAVKQNKSKETLVLLGADHGSVEVSHEATNYLDVTMPLIADSLERTGTGLVKAPAGSRRDFFLHIKEDKRETLRRELKERLAPIAEAYPTQILIDQGFFGNPAKVSASFLSRVGDTVILPYAGQSVFWAGDGRFRNNHLGSHGGLTPEEMIVPLLALQA